MASRGSGCAAQLADEPDQMSLGCGAQARLPADRSGYVRGRGVLSGEQVVGADAEPVAELDEQIEGWSCLVALDAGDVLVRDAQLSCDLVLGQLEGFPAGADPAADSRTRCLRHPGSVPGWRIGEQLRN
jgi:hypothetical protein